jgi:hypothetical protein
MEAKEKSKFTAHDNTVHSSSRCVVSERLLLAAVSQNVDEMQQLILVCFQPLRYHVCPSLQFHNVSVSFIMSFRQLAGQLQALFSSASEYCVRLFQLIVLCIYGSTILLLDLGRFFGFLILYTVGMTPWTGDQPVARPLPTQNKRTQTSMPSVGFEPTIPLSRERRHFMP